MVRYYAFGRGGILFDGPKLLPIARRAKAEIEADARAAAASRPGRTVSDITILRADDHGDARVMTCKLRTISSKAVCKKDFKKF